MTATPDLDGIVFAHAAYRLGEEFARRHPDVPTWTVRDADGLEAAISGARTLVVSGLWRDSLLGSAPQLRFIQSISAGTDQFGREALAGRGVRLASAQGGNERAVAEHAMALLLALARQLPQSVRDQEARHWRPMIADPTVRQDELSGKTMLIVGLGRIGQRLSRLAQAFDMRVVGMRRSPRRADDAADEVVGPDRLAESFRQADIVVLTCPLTPETERLVDAAALAALRPGALLVNVARGRVVDQAALIDALADGRLGGAALDCFEEEPLPPSSPLWAMPNVLVTPHAAGETRRYETAVIDLLIDNLGRLGRGEALRNAVV